MEFKRERVLEKFAMLREFSPKNRKFGSKSKSVSNSTGPVLRTHPFET